MSNSTSFVPLSKVNVEARGLPQIQTYIIKIAGACNLNCSYCYVYNMGDTGFLRRPRVMSRETAELTLERIFSYSIRGGQTGIALILHGGEPLLAGKEWMEWYLRTIREKTPQGLRVSVAIQTNGVLVDEEWLDLFARYQVQVGVSIDGPEEWHDRFRVNFAGQGSYRQVRRALDTLVGRGYENPRWGALVVANCEYSGGAIFNHLADIGARKIDFLWPDYHHDRLPPWSPGALGDYYIEIFEEWCKRGDPNIKIRWFNSVLRILFGGQSMIDSLGTNPLGEAVIESDGSLEPLDALRTCGDGFCELGLNVHRHQVDDLVATDLVRACHESRSLLSSQCHSCPAYKVCGGGWLPHRWSQGRGFSNPSVHCPDLLKVINHVAARTVAEIQQTHPN